jgi:hypothetical protein
MVKHMLVTALSIGLVVATVASSWGSAQAQGPYHVVILVVDDFTNLDWSALSTEQFDSADNCAVSLESQAFAVRGVSAAPIPQPHGEIVYAEMEDMLASFSTSDLITLVKVDAQGVTTDVVAGKIQDAMDANPADFYVVNMSFAIIPCDYIQVFADYGTQLLDAQKGKDSNRYRSLFQRSVIFYNDTVFPVMSKKAQQVQNLDPLQELLAAHSSTVIPVASAGNFGLDFPFWPGAWGQVVSVSASTGQGFYPSAAWDKKKDTPLLTTDSAQPGKTQRISNYGEIMMPGEYTSESGNVLGTSFAAPRLSVVMASYLSQVGGDFCRKSDGSPALAYGHWDNLTLEQAAQQYCTNLTAYLPQR